MPADPSSTAQLGRDLVAAELRKRGFEVKEALVDRRPTLLVERAGVRRRVHVSAKRRGTWQTSIRYGAKVAPAELRTCTWIFVNVGSAEPVFYVVPEAWMVEDIYVATQRYLAQHGGTRKYSPDSTHHAITENRIERWRNRWDVLEMQGDIR